MVRYADHSNSQVGIKVVRSFYMKQNRNSPSYRPEGYRT